MIEKLFSLLTSVISVGGYPGLMLLTFLDSTVLPLPNETFMPFVGALIAEGRFTFLNVLIISTVGAVLGSLTSYAIGYYGAEPFVKKFGKYLRIKQQDIEKTHTIFEKYGDRIILISRFIPVVRQFSSLPAGAAKMNIKKFVLYTAIGSTLWNSAILGLGYTVGINSEKFETYSGFIDIVILLLVLFFVLFVIWKKKYNKK